MPGSEPAATADTWQVSGRLSYTGVPYSELQQGTRSGPNPDQLRVDVHLATTEIELASPFGTQLGVRVPAGVLATSTLQQSRTDTNVGDTEVRVRQRLPWSERAVVELTAGVVLPTGPYAVRSGAANVPPEAQFLTLGRGVTWALAEAQASMGFGERYAGYLQLSARTPLSRPEDEFDWGSEARASAGARIALGGALAALAIGEWQWRGGATEPDPFAGGRVDSANAGGTFWTVTPAMSCRLGPAISIQAGLRIPVHADVRGNQLVPGVGGFVSVSGSLAERPAPRGERVARSAQLAPSPKARPVPGAITVIDYWAAWCKPCKTIASSLEQATPGWQGVEVVTIDASGWPDEGPALPPGSAGLPVVEVYDAEGNRTHLLTGNDALRVVDVVNELRAQSR